MNTYFRKMIAVMTICACVGGGVVFADSNMEIIKAEKIQIEESLENIGLIKVLDESGLKALKENEVNWIEIEAPENSLDKPMHIIVPNGSVIESDTIDMAKILKMNKNGLGMFGPIEYKINTGENSQNLDLDFIKIEKLDDTIEIEKKEKKQ